MTEEEALWQRLKNFTAARVAIGRTGAGLPTSEHLRFQLDHARARDAVYSELETARLEAELRAMEQETVAVQSAASDRRVYLQRPDLGRVLDADSEAKLHSAAESDVVFVLADGLSASAVNRNGVPFLQTILPELQKANWKISPVVLVAQGRVAIGDAVAAALGAKTAVVLIGERPGLTSPDSLGLYLTYAPRPGLTTDAERNCISNVRPEGLPYEVAASRLFYLLTESRRRCLSGVALKEAAPTILETVPEKGQREKGEFLAD